MRKYCRSMMPSGDLYSGIWDMYSKGIITEDSLYSFLKHCNRMDQMCNILIKSLKIITKQKPNTSLIKDMLFIIKTDQINRINLSNKFKGWDSYAKNAITSKYRNYLKLMKEIL